MGYKVEIAKHYNLGGIMWWATDIDDFKGTWCNQGKYPLMSAAKAVWHEGYVPTTNFATTRPFCPLTAHREPTGMRKRSTATGTMKLTVAMDSDLVQTNFIIYHCVHQHKYMNMIDMTI